jgi:hypothetical protein
MSILEQTCANSPGFMTFAKCFCINPVSDKGYYSKRTGWVLIELATRAEINFKRLGDAKHHLIDLYMKAASKKSATEAC